MRYHVRWSNYICFLITEAADGSDDEGVEDETYEAKASRKKEKKRQEREAQRQVLFILILIHLKDYPLSPVLIILSSNCICAKNINMKMES